nr:hypothetical protein CFP56_21352 [Quercus suber]
MQRGSIVSQEDSENVAWHSHRPTLQYQACVVTDLVLANRECLLIEVPAYKVIKVYYGSRTGKWFRMILRVILTFAGCMNPPDMTLRLDVRSVNRRAWLTRLLAHDTRLCSDRVH